MSASQSYRPEWMSPHAKDFANAEASAPESANAYRPAPEPAGHRITLTRPQFLRPPLVITTNANPSHADALRDLHAMFQTTTSRPYLPRRGDALSHEVTK